MSKVKYHVNPRAGDPSPCHATVRGCPPGIVAAAHVNSEAECRSMYEKVMVSSLLPPRATRATARKVWKLPKSMDYEVYHKKIPAMHAYHAAVTA